MPNYDLQCKSCNTQHKIHASMTEKAENRILCPECGSNNMETLFITAPAHVKGQSTPMRACPNSHGCGHSCPHAG